jgi:Ni,Fe-hydrogenase I large subunit
MKKEIDFEKRKKINIKIMKVFGIIIGVPLLLIFTVATCQDPIPKTKQEIAAEKLAIIQAKIQSKKDSLQEIRDKKIDFALTYLKMQIQKNMKNPDSYEVIDRVYDTKDTGNVVKLGIRFRGDNSFGGKSISSVDAVYNFKKDNVIITKQVNE